MVRKALIPFENLAKQHGQLVEEESNLYETMVRALDDQITLKTIHAEEEKQMWQPLKEKINTFFEKSSSFNP